MKKRLFALLLSLVMLLGIAPAAMADDGPALKFRSMDYNNSTDSWYEAENRPLNGNCSAESGTNSIVKFYYDDGQSTNVVPFEELTATGAVTLEKFGDFIMMNYVGFGAGTVSYTPEGGETVTVSVEVSLPPYGFYKENEVSEENFITEFNVTGENDVFYFLANSSAEQPRTITNVALTGDFDAIADAEWISDTCWKITVTGTPDGNQWCNLTYAGVDGEETFSGWNAGINLINAKPQIGYRWYGDTGDYLNDRWTSSPNSTSSDIVFYYKVNGTETPIAMSELSSSDEAVVKLLAPDNSGSNAVRIQSVNFGTAEIRYTHENGSTCVLPVTIDIPDCGYYKAETASRENYITEFDVTGENDVFYFVAKSSDDITRTINSFTLRNDFAEIASAEKVSDTCYKITVTGNFQSGRWYNADVNYTNSGSGWSNTNTGNWGIGLNDVKPGLKFRSANWNGSAFVDDSNNMLQSSWNPGKGSDNIVSFFFVEGENQTKLTVDDLTVTGNAISLKKSGNFIEMSADNFGTATISYTKNGKTYSMTVNVALPYIGTYKAQARTEENYLNFINIAELNESVAWIIKDGGFTGEELANLTMTLDGEEFTAFEKVARADTGYDIKLDLSGISMGWKQLDMSYGNGNNANFGIDYQLQGKAAYVGDYAIGFAWTEEGSGIVRINEGNWRHGNSVDGVVTENYEWFRDMQIAAGIKKTDAQGAVYYEVETANNKVDLEITKVWIEECTGEEGAFSLDQNSLVQEKTGYDTTDITLYSKHGHESLILIWAEVEVTVDGVTTTERVSMMCELTVNTRFEEHRPTGDTVETLNTYLETLADNVQEGGMYYIFMAPGEYTGTINIPSIFDAGPDGYSLSLKGTVDINGNATVVNGNINLNLATVDFIDDIHFKGDSTYTKAIYGGSLLNIHNCSFEGYDIALDSSDGTVVPSRGNVFVNNNTAINVDVANIMNVGMNSIAWRNNTFIKNGTAVRVKSLNDFISSYYLRIVDSNFIGNTKDFDVDCEGTLYMYRNYYGNIHNQTKDMPINDYLHVLAGATTDTKLNQTATSNSPNIDCIQGSKVITNPRWKKPVLNWWNSQAAIETIFPASAHSTAILTAEEPYENTIVADWTLDTQIVNKEADDLIINEEAFATEGEKQIDIVDEQENPVGTWNFD